MLYLQILIISYLRDTGGSPVVSMVHMEEP